MAAAIPPEPPLQRDLRKIAPLFAAAVAEGLNRCWLNGLDPVVHEAVRTAERQEWLYGIGRLYVPPGYDDGTVTNVRDPRWGWHFFGLAVDIRSKAHGWDDPHFFARCAVYFEAAGCDWGGRWSKPDLPHFQWGHCRPTPSDLSRQGYAEGGAARVWQLVGAAA